MSFVEKIQNSLGELVYLVHGKDKGKDAWHYLLVDKLKLAIFLQDVKSGKLDVTNYGVVLYSGWGENPPQHIIDEVKAKYS